MSLMGLETVTDAELGCGIGLVVRPFAWGVGPPPRSARYAIPRAAFSLYEAYVFNFVLNTSNGPFKSHPSRLTKVLIPCASSSKREIYFAQIIHLVNLFSIPANFMSLQMET